MSVYPLADKAIYVAGHGGMVGQALVRRLARADCRVLTAPRALDLRRQAEVEAWFAEHRPDAVILAAARVGGIMANATRPGEFLYDNLSIAVNVVEAARRQGTERLLFLGSSCIYPRLSEQPIGEHALLAGPLEPTNEAYAVAKIAGVKLCETYRRQYGCDFIAAMPTNLYGPGDNYDLASSHVIPALIRKAHEAKVAGAMHFTIWGSGTARREFLHVDDLAEACVFLLENYAQEGPINVGAGADIAIGELAALVAETVGFNGAIERDASKPDGTPRKLLDSSRLSAMGWRAKIGLRKGLSQAYADFLAGQA